MNLCLGQDNKYNAKKRDIYPALGWGTTMKHYSERFGKKELDAMCF